MDWQQWVLLVWLVLLTARVVAAVGQPIKPATTGSQAAGSVLMLIGLMFVVLSI